MCLRSVFVEDEGYNTIKEVLDLTGMLDYIDCKMGVGHILMKYLR